jgi:hypothetical protein
MSGDLWDAATDFEAEEKAGKVTAARIATAPVWNILSQASDLSDYANRKALVRDRIQKECARISPMDFGHIAQLVEEAYDSDFKILAAARQHWLDEARDVLNNKQFSGTVEKPRIDMQTAHVLTKIHDALKPEHQEMFKAMDLAKAADVAWKLASPKKTSSKELQSHEVHHVDPQKKSVFLHNGDRIGFAAAHQRGLDVESWMADNPDKSFGKNMTQATKRQTHTLHRYRDMIGNNYSVNHDDTQVGHVWNKGDGDKYSAHVNTYDKSDPDSGMKSTKIGEFDSADEARNAISTHRKNHPWGSGHAKTASLSVSASVLDESFGVTGSFHVDAFGKLTATSEAYPSQEIDDEIDRANRERREPTPGSWDADNDLPWDDTDNHYKKPSSIKYAHAAPFYIRSMGGQFAVVDSANEVKGTFPDKVSARMHQKSLYSAARTTKDMHNDLASGTHYEKQEAAERAVRDRSKERQQQKKDNAPGDQVQEMNDRLKDNHGKHASRFRRLLSSVLGSGETLLETCPICGREIPKSEIDAHMAKRHHDVARHHLDPESLANPFQASRHTADDNPFTSDDSDSDSGSFMNPSSSPDMADGTSNSPMQNMNTPENMDPKTSALYVRASEVARIADKILYDQPGMSEPKALVLAGKAYDRYHVGFGGADYLPVGEENLIKCGQCGKKAANSVTKHCHNCGADQQLLTK